MTNTEKICENLGLLNKGDKRMSCKEYKELQSEIKELQKIIEEMKEIQEKDRRAECPTCHGTGWVKVTNWLTKGMSKEELAEEKRQAHEEIERHNKALRRKKKNERNQ